MQITIRAARVNAGLTQSDVAAELEVTKKTVGSWEKGATMPKLKYIDPLCKLLGVQYDDIRWKV